MNLTNQEEVIIDFDNLYDSMMKCRRKVSWKPSVKAFMINSEENLHRLHDQLVSGTFKNGKPREILITYPKRREALSISFKDRIYQRSINDNILYPAMSKTFIESNVACQNGKGSRFTRKLLNRYLWAFYRNYGLNGYVLQIDIKGYYRHMHHDKVLKDFERQLDCGTLKRVKEVLDFQYKGEKGYNPGSQMVQIAGISHPSALDHLIKEKLHIKYYIRYMDDFLLFHQNKEYLEKVLKVIKEQLATLGLEVNAKKTHIRSIKEPFMFIGFVYRVTPTGKIVTVVNPQTIKHTKRKIKKMIRLCLKGRITKAKVDECFNAHLNHISNGNTSYMQIQRLRKWYKNTWKELRKECQNTQKAIYQSHSR